MKRKTQPQDTLISKWPLYKRDYPWRHRINPYRIMVAEFMLQRTRADQVANVYKDFTEKYPDVVSLSKARMRDVGKYTKHLGIHWRAKHFVESSRFIVKAYGGKIPADREKLLAIPGVGEYVAGAILTAGYRRPEWVIDANIARFFDRLYNFRLKGELRRKPKIVDAAKKFFTHPQPRKLLFSLLDFTALICTPRKPRCTICPLNRGCRYNRKELKVVRARA